jgi:hypothetical protein
LNHIFYFAKNYNIYAIQANTSMPPPSPPLGHPRAFSCKVYPGGWAFELKPLPGGGAFEIKLGRGGFKITYNLIII